ncbi:leucyl/phenylalanyl-tRNA--protein transferase [Methylophaga sp. OBS1]|uniref:leucyl/phenylalanyl-tRNA--protein transferase n=1 Tax=Methylophaga sp. OBS1 TaxID=2991933 RepID=UPI002255676B|nr:leucyl/phenylalanyl-tRNA--protein transferase [Methylophaga sp. OBS1]MCX4193255.1 leucyl/phenylalanyl-tRNA--protein transferase [Methylophaga sp. OBS1]
MSITWLAATTQSRFPPVEQATEHGLLAAGGDLSAERLLDAYRHGIFPWFNKNDPILWWCPDPRMVLYTNRVHISKSLKRQLRKQDITVTLDTAFEQVMHACSAPRANQPLDPDNRTWIHEEMIKAYSELHSLGYAHSVECWQQNRLVGGLYGVAIGKAFFGESMFSFVTDSSKIALVALCQQLKRWDMPVIDCQIYSDHLARMGAEEIPREVFLGQLQQLCYQPAVSSPWHIDPDLPLSL